MVDVGIQVSTLSSTKQTSERGSQQSSTSIEEQAISSLRTNDSVDVGLGKVYESLTVLADKIISRLDELLANELPEGIRSLDPAQHTSEATAQRIVDGSTALFGVYAQQNPELGEEELIDGFMETIRGGIEQGYQQAASLLGELGAFTIDGVQEGIEETMRLVEEKLKAFEDDYRSSISKDKSEQESPSESGNNGEEISNAGLDPFDAVSAQANT
jgi:hypothetical protein